MAELVADVSVGGLDIPDSEADVDEPLPEGMVLSFFFFFFFLKFLVHVTSECVKLSSSCHHN